MLHHLLLGVCVHNMLWGVVCPGAPCTGVPTLRTCTHDTRASSMLDFASDFALIWENIVCKLSNLVVLQK